MNRPIGLLLIGAGLLLLFVGVLVYFGALNWVGRLPGDIRIEGERTRVYIPLATMLLVSLLLSLAWYLVRRFW